MRVDEKTLAKIQTCLLIAVVILLSSIFVTHFFINGVMIQTNNSDLAIHSSSDKGYSSYDVSYGASEAQTEPPQTEVTDNGTENTVPTDTAAPAEVPVAAPAVVELAAGSAAQPNQVSFGSGSVSGGSSAGVVFFAGTSPSTVATKPPTQPTTAAPVTTIAPTPAPVPVTIETDPYEEPVTMEITSEPVPTEEITEATVITEATESSAPTETVIPSDLTEATEATDSQPTDTTGTTAEPASEGTTGEATVITEGETTDSTGTTSAEEAETVETANPATIDEASTEDISLAESPEGSKSVGGDTTANISRYADTASDSHVTLMTIAVMGVLVLLAASGILFVLQSGKKRYRHMRRGK